MGLGIDIGIYFHTREGVEALVLDTEHDRHIDRDVGIFILAITDIIDIIEELVHKVMLVLELLNLTATLHVRSHSTGSTDSEIHQETRRAIFLTRLKLIQETHPTGSAHTPGIVTLRRQQGPLAYLRIASDIMIHLRMRCPAEQNSEQKKSI